MDKDAIQTKIIELLLRLEWFEREEVFSHLRLEVFCIYCGFETHGKTCHCTNDE